MAEPIEFYFDFSSPYGYFASYRIDALAAECGRETVWKPILLGVVFKETGQKPLAHIPLKGPYCLNDWQRLGRYYGVAYVHPDPFPIATQAAARAFYWLDARDPDLAKRFAREAYHAYFGEGRSIMAPDAVGDVAQRVGVDVDEALEAIATEDAKRQLREENERAIARGVFGSPYFLVDGEGFWGVDRLEMLRDWVRRGGW
jgi:2-hydroxychromene-2-carboxylate isomerase